MAREIRKYKLTNFPGPTTVQIPRESHHLYIESGGIFPYLWSLIDPGRDWIKEESTFVAYTEGALVEGYPQYIGSVPLYWDTKTYHVFEVPYGA